MWFTSLMFHLCLKTICLVLLLSFVMRFVTELEGEQGGQTFLINLKSYTSKKKPFQGVDQVQHSVQC